MEDVSVEQPEEIVATALKQMGRWFGQRSMKSDITLCVNVAGAMICSFEGGQLHASPPLETNDHYSVHIDFINQKELADVIVGVRSTIREKGTAAMISSLLYEVAMPSWNGSHRRVEVHGATALAQLLWDVWLTHDAQKEEHTANQQSRSLEQENLSRDWIMVHHVSSGIRERVEMFQHEIDQAASSAQEAAHHKRTQYGQVDKGDDKMSTSPVSKVEHPAWLSEVISNIHTSANEYISAASVAACAPPAPVKISPILQDSQPENVGAPTPEHGLPTGTTASPIAADPLSTSGVEISPVLKEPPSQVAAESLSSVAQPKFAAEPQFVPEQLLSIGQDEMPNGLSCAAGKSAASTPKVSLLTVESSTAVVSSSFPVEVSPVQTEIAIAKESSPVPEPLFIVPELLAAADTSELLATGSPVAAGSSSVSRVSSAVTLPPVALAQMSPVAPESSLETPTVEVKASPVPGSLTTSAFSPPAKSSFIAKEWQPSAGALALAERIKDSDQGTAIRSSYVVSVKNFI